MNANELKVGTEVYYTGDQCNASGHFKVSTVVFGQVKLNEIDGDRRFTVYPNQIGDVYHGHCNPRFVTATARKNYFDALRKANS